MKPADSVDRERIVKDLDTTFLVEAGAGSGKTRSLVERMIACLRGGVCTIDTMAAVTFTRKAAAELRERFQTKLEKAYAEAGEEKEKRRLGESLRYLEQCFIGTIHSFCARMLKERPIEIGLDPDFKEMDEIEDAVYREQCWLDYMVEVRKNNPPELEALGEVGLEPEDLKDAFATISEFPEVRLVEGRDSPPDYEAIKAKLEAFLAEMRRDMPRNRADGKQDGFQIKMIRIFNRQDIIGFSTPLVLMETLEDMSRSFGMAYTKWPDKDKAKEIAASLEVFQENLVKNTLIEWKEYRHSRIIDFLKPAVFYYYEQRKKHSLVNFADLLLSVSKLLRDYPEVRGYFQKKYTHILVDEFQDTDPVQAEMLMYLTGSDQKEKNWRKLKPRPGALFLVGDPKQSIYRFRRADIDTYNVARDIVLKSGGDVLKLTANFRSLDFLAAWNNPLFKSVFPVEINQYQAPFAPINTVRPEEKGAWSGVYKITVERKTRHKQELIAQDDAAVIGDWMKWACDGNVKLARTDEEKAAGVGDEAVPSDFLLLFRYKKLMDIYARALEARGIPYEISGGDAFSDSSDIRDIVNLMRALLEPDNPVWVVAVLKGIFFGASDNALLEFKREGGRFSYLKVDGDFRSQGAKYVAECLKVLKTWWRWTKDYPVSTVLEKILEDSGFSPYLASSEEGSSRAGNVLKLLEFLRSQERHGVTSFSDLVDFMVELVDVKEIEEMSLNPGRPNAVRLMNLHKAKGLEAPIVFLAQPVGIPNFELDKHVVRLEKEGPRGYFLFKKKKWFHSEILSQPVGWEECAKEETKYEVAEEDRLMYVAATRTKNMMVVSTYDGNLTNKAWTLLDGYLGGVPELEIPLPAEVVAKEEVTVSESQFGVVKVALAENVKKTSQPSYLVESVTSLAKAEGEIPGWSESGLGMSWGRVVHQVLRFLARGDDLDLELLVQNELVAEGRDPGEKFRMLELINAIIESEFWARMQKAEKKYFEIPFSVKTDSKELPGIEGGNGKPVILTGVIDLVFWEDDGWVIVDYKTDDIGSGQSLQPFIDFYSPQVQIYTRFWSQITGQKVNETCLFFTSVTQSVKILQK